MKETISLSVIFPCFNEEKSIVKNIYSVGKFLKSRFQKFEIIAVNNGSTDNTLQELKKSQILKNISVRIIHQKHNE